MIPNYLAKFYPESSWKYIFEDWTVRFTPPEELNDPFECSPHINSFMTPDTYKKLLEKHEHKRPIYSLIKDNDELIDISVKMLETFGRWGGMKINKYLRGTRGIFCLTGKIKNLLMWSHYANSHKGFVVIFNSRHEFFKPNGFYKKIHKVKYVNDRYSGALFDNESLQSHLHKGKIWEYENEYRVFARLNRTNDHLWKDASIQGVTSIYPSMICGIIFGAHMGQSSILNKCRELRNNSECAHIWLKKANLHPSKYQLILTEFESY